MTKTFDCELVVIGSGGTGFGAACTAAQAGIKNIFVLEKTHFLGGNSRMAGGGMYSPEKHCPGKDPQFARDLAFRNAISFHHYTRVEPKVFRAFIDNAQETQDWMQASGFYGYAQKYPFGNFYNSIKKMAAAFEAGGNTIMIDTEVTAIETENGRVARVKATNKEGDTLVFNTPYAVIATGGFTGNSALLHKYFPKDYDDCFYTDALPLQGDGIKLAEGAGAELADYCTIVKENAYSCDSRLDAPNRAAHSAKSLWVNCRGERFHDESKTSNETTNALVRQPGMIGFALFDQNTINAGEDHFYVPQTEDEIALYSDEGGGPGGGGGMGPGGPGGHGGPGGPGGEGGSPADHMGGIPGGGPPDMSNLSGQFDKEIALKTGWAAKADTIEGLAEFIGADPAVLRATVDEYNADCKAGRDSLFAKNPRHLTALTDGPFYALKFRPIIIETIGPIIVNEKMQVLDKQRKAIPGLYAGGVCTVGWQGCDYHLSGSNLGYACTSGRIAGKQIAAELGK